MSDRLLTDLALKGLIEIEEVTRDNQTVPVLDVWDRVAQIVAEYAPLLKRPRTEGTYPTRRGRIALTPAMRERFKAARLAVGKSQHSIRTPHVGRNIVFSLETGVINSVDPRQVQELAEVYGVSEAWLLTGKESQP